MVYFNNVKIVKGHFPNKEKQYITVHNLTNFGVLRVEFESNEDLFDMLIFKKYLDEQGIKTTLEIKFIPYGQSDREFENSMFSFKYFAKLINDANFLKVRIYDPHSPVIAACIDRCEISYPMTGINYEDYDLIYYPDAGAAKKYSEIYKHPYIYGTKKRNLETGEIIKYEIAASEEEIKGKRILIRDDLVVYGGTFKHAARALREMGAASVDLFVTHLMPCAEEFYKNRKDYGIDNIYSENTLRTDWYI